MINYKKLTSAIAAGIIAIFTITGCAMPWQKAADDSSSNVSTVSAGNLSQSGENALSLEFDSEDLDSSYNESECTKINLSGSGATVSGSGVTVENGNITITSVGSYIISGTLTDGSIKVNCSEKGTVRLILNGASISSSSTAPVVVEEAKKVLVTLADGTTNTITDKTRQSVDDEDFSSAVYSKADLVFNGSGTLNVNAGYRNGIKSTDDLKVVSGTFNITSNEDGIIGKDLLGIKDGKFTIKSGSDGMKSTYDTDTSKGNIVITGGEFDITASNDGIHCNEDILISGGNLTISSGDDGVHADDNLQVDGGTIDIKKCCEGLEGVQITLNDGDISIVASDDGINAADGSSSSGMGMGGFGGGQASSSDSSVLLTINGGNIFVNAGGDGLDSNGNIVMNGGNVTVLGPTSDGDTALDFDGTFTINGGVLMAFGSSGMLETPTTAQNGCCIVTTLGTVSANSAFSLTDSSGNVIMSYIPTKNYASAIVYSSDIKSGSTYTVTAGSTTQSITVNSNVTTNGVSGGFGGGQNGGFGGGQRGGQPGGSNQQGGNQQGGNQQGGNQQDGMPGGNSGNGRSNSASSSTVNQV
jgi:hypothetical protein